MGINAPRAPRRERRQFCLGTWKQPKCPLTEEWIKKMWYIYTMECHLVVKRDKIVPFAETRMGLETVIQVKSEREKHISSNNTWNLEKWYR